MGLVGISRDITARTKADRLRDEQARVLEMIAKNEPLESILERLVHMMESQLDGVLGSVLLLDQDKQCLRHGAAPSLPVRYCEAIDGYPIGPIAGSCGTAAFTGRMIVVTDIATDPLWAAVREIPLSHGLASCWSMPVFSYLGDVIGTFAMYSRAVRAPTPDEIKLAVATSRIAAIAIERKAAEDRVTYLAHHDVLTGLPNRTSLRARLSEDIGAAASNGMPLALVFIDLDDFKLVNDSLGHNAGDTVLKIVADRISSIIGPNDLVTRLGGDEFVVLMAGNSTTRDNLPKMLEAIRIEIARPIPAGGKVFHVSCSLGVARYPQDGNDPDALLTNADAAMYRAKEKGRNCVAFYAADIDAKAQERMAMKEAMRLGLERQEFYLDYQPQIDLETGRICGVEALARWRHRELGPISPATFIPLAEETGLIVPLGEFLLRQACRQLVAWRAAGIEPMTVSVNVSARQFHEKNWAEQVRSILNETGLDPHQLELEITESLLMRDTTRAIRTMGRLRKIGVSFAIDDFGTGYSNLSALKDLPVSRLKLDQSFIGETDIDPRNRGIAATVISLGHLLGLTVIAEGVEKPEQVAFLRGCRCDAVQGYLISRPIAAHDLPQFVRTYPRIPADQTYAL